jgi:hypothetical protein
MSDVQCKKNRNEVISAAKASVIFFEPDSVCHSCLNFDICREEEEQAKIEGGSNGSPSL